MSIERDLIISLLKLTKTEPVELETVNKEAKLPYSVCINLLRKMQIANLVYFNNNKVGIVSGGRLKLTVKAAEQGADVERLSRVLSWQEFEGIAAVALEQNGYSVSKNVRFKQNSKRWEIDVVGCRKPLTLCIDCKHWHQGLRRSALRRMVDSQLKRVEAFAEALGNHEIHVECKKWETSKLVPLILSLLPASCKFYKYVPIVPVLKLQDFINQLPVYIESVKIIPVKFSHL